MSRQHLLERLAQEEEAKRLLEKDLARMKLIKATKLVTLMSQDDRQRIFGELSRHLEELEAGNRATEEAIREYVREEKQKPQSLARAFKLMLFEEAVHEKLDLPAEKLLSLRDYYRSGGYVASEEMEEMLGKAGWEKREDGTWQGL